MKGFEFPEAKAMNDRNRCAKMKAKAQQLNRDLKNPDTAKQVQDAHQITPQMKVLAAELLAPDFPEDDSGTIH